MSGPILVTGATGTVGREVVRALVADPRSPEVRAGGRDLRLLPGGAAGVALDFERPETFPGAFADVDAVFLATPLEPAMVARGAALVEAARAAGVRRVVRLSALGTHFRPPIALGRAHRAVEVAIEASGLEWTFLRPNAFMQNYLTYAGASLRAQGAFYMPQGDGAVSLVDVRDIAAVAVEALLDPAHARCAYELTGPEALTNAEVAVQLGRALGRPVRYVDVPDADARAAMLAAGMAPWVVDVIMELYAVSRAGRAGAVTDDVRRVLGRAPTAFAAFAHHHAALLAPDA